MLMKSRNWLKWLSFILPVLYYGYFGVSGLRDYPHDFMRSAACMMIGTNMCLNQERFNAFFEKCRSRLLLTAVEILCLLFTVVVSYRNIGALMNLCLIAFIIIAFVLSMDYKHTENVQFEDDDYYYYVKAIPKTKIAAPDRKVRSITGKGAKEAAEKAESAISPEPAGEEAGKEEEHAG